MRKGKNQAGNNFYGIKVEHFVTLSSFAKALCEYAYNKNEQVSIIRCLKKSEAMEILKERLFFYGGNGELGEENLDTDKIDAYNNLYAEAINWVKKNYPYLYND